MERNLTHSYNYWCVITCSPYLNISCGKMVGNWQIIYAPVTISTTHVASKQMFFRGKKSNFQLMATGLKVSAQYLEVLLISH